MKVYKTGDSTSKLSYEQAQEIRVLFNTGKHKRKELAVMYNVTRDSISKILRGVTHKRELWRYEN